MLFYGERHSRWRHAVSSYSAQRNQTDLVSLYASLTGKASLPTDSLGQPNLLGSCQATGELSGRRTPLRGWALRLSSAALGRGLLCLWLCCLA
jgi:hypothetical protein